MEDKLYKAWQSAGKYYDLPDYETFKKDMKDEGKLHRFHESLGEYYDVPDYDTFKADMWGTAAQQQPTGQAGAAPAGQTTSAGEMVGQAAQQEQPTVEPSASQTRAQVKPAAVQQSAPAYNFTYFDESAIDPDEGELRMSKTPAGWKYSERVNKSRGAHTKDNSPILRMSLNGDQLDANAEREALAELKDMSDEEIYKYTNGLYDLAWGSLTNDQRREAASRLAAAGQELHARDLGLGHYGDAYRRENAWRTILQDPEYRKLYDRGQWADPVGTLSKQYDRLFAEQATGGTMGQQQATKIANRVLRAADKNQMFTWAIQEAERTGGDPYKIYENIYDRFHAAVKEKLGAYNTRGQAAGLLGDIDAMIAEKYSAAEKEDRSRRSGFARMLSDAMSADRGGDPVEDILMNDPDMWALRYAKRTIEGVNNLIAEADHNAASGNFATWLESSFAGGAVRGFGQAVFDPRTWDMGLGDVRDATALMTALDKSDKGKPLTKAEQAMLDAKAVELAANAYFKSQVGYGYEAGKVTGESLPFMLEMMINPASRTGGLAVNKLVRYALKRFPQRGAAAVERQAVRAAERRAVRMAERRGMSTFGEKAANRILESAGLLIETAGKKTAGGKAVRAAVKTAGNVAGSAVMAGTTGLPGVIADTENRMIGQLDYDADETGAFHVTGHGFGVPMIEAFKDALVARGIENVTEMSEFDVLSNWLGGLTRKALDKLHMSDVYKFFDDIKMSDVAKVVQDFEKNTHWQGTFGEYLEEVEGGILNAWLVGDQTLDQNPDTGVFNVDNNVKTFLGVSLLGGAFSTVQTVGYRTPKARMRKNIEDADKQASELWGGTWQQFKNSVDGADDEEMEVLLANIVVNGNYSVEQRRAAAQYIKSVVAYRGAMKGEEIRAVSGESNPNDEQSYEQGYQAQGEEREGITDELQQAEQRLIDMGFNMDSFEGWTSDKFERTIKDQDHGYSDEELSVIREYLRAKAASDGINQRVEDDIDTQVQQASDLVDKQTNQGTGMVHRAVLNEQHGSQEVFVTGGQLVMTGDGTMIDTEASDQSLFVYNPATGQAEQYTPQDFQSVEDPVSPEQLKSEAAMDIRQAVEQQAEADMNGYVQQGGAYDMVDDKGNAMHGTVLELRPDNTALVQVDGMQNPVAMPTQQLQTWVDNAKQSRMSVEPTALPTRSAGARGNAANTGRAENATNGATGAAQSAAIPRQGAAQATAQRQAPAAVEPIEMDEKTGEPAWNKTTPERGYQYLTGESGLSGEDITSLIDDRIAQADAAIAKASKGGTIDQRLQARQAKDYWEGVKALHEAAKTAAQQRPTGQAGTNGRGTTASQGTGTTAVQRPTGQAAGATATAPAGTVRVEAGQAETMPVGSVAVNIDGTRAEDRGQLGIRPEDEAYFLKTMSPRMMRLLDKVAKSLGWKIRLYNGTTANERGNFSNGVVWVNRRAMTSKLAQWILGHEMTHGMGDRTKRGETFNDYKKLACDYHRRQVGSERYEQEVQDLIKAYQDHLKSLGMDASNVDRAYVEEEIACDVTGDLLMNNPEMIGKLFSGVDNPGRVKRIIDMIVDFLDYLKSKLPWRSEERQAFDDLINRLNNLYRDAKAQNDIAKATAREEGSQVESGEGERTGSSFSITGNAEGSGFTCSETVLEIWRVPQEDGTYKEEEHWVKKPLLDSEGNVVFRMGDREFNGNNPITVDDLKSNPDTVLNYMLGDALRAGTIDEVKADQVRQQYADMLNLYLEKGLAENGGFENLENNWLWVGETVFRTVASNSDEQYSYSMDITKVCKKNEAVIRAISALQVKNGYGVTPAQILEIYEATDAEGFQVPCPVCYVFSRYINNGKYATAIVNGMQKYGKHLPGQAEEWTVEKWVEEKQKAEANAKKMKSAIDNANNDVKIILQQIDTLCREITSGKLSKEEAESKRRHVRALDQRYRAALDVISQEALPRWIKAFVIEGSDQGGWSLRKDAALPEDMDDFTLHALDIRKTASAMEKYPALTRYRRAGGSVGGKEITFASNNELGTIVMGLGISKDKLDDYPNYYQLAAEAATDEERQALLQKARERFDKARLYAQRQTLRGGQRMWSWSDNIESLSSDVASNLMQLELLGGALQTYSKQLEGVKMVAAMNGYVNASLMGYGDGIREVGPDEIENGRLKDDIWDVNNKGRRRIIANAGSPVYHNEADGKDYVLVFDDVVGIDPFGHDGKRGLFSLNEEYDRAGNILVGMNDIHVRAAMADPRVFFIIPWHASGMSNHILQQMFNILGVDMDKFVSTDYTKMQEETNYLLKKDDGSPKKKVPKEVEDFWDSHTFEDEFACGTGHIENGDRQGGLSESQLHYRSLRDAIFDGAAKDNEDMMKEILADEFLSQVYRQVTTRVDDGKMTEKDKEFIYPYEYWDETSTVENADVNGRRYVEYCRRMGFKPKFTGKFDDKTGYSPEGNFADDPGYWKLLIDRRMYDRRGNYQDLTPIDSSGLDSSMYDPDQTSEEFNVTEVATNEGAEKIADIVYQRDAERTGSMPAPNLDMTMDEAVSRYKEVTALQASLIKAEREALTAADVAKQKVEKANTLKAQDTDGRKAKSVARAQESARKAMEVAKQKAREVNEIAGQLGDEKKEMIERESGEDYVKFSLVEDQNEVKRLEEEPKMEGYRNVSLQGDGSLRSPMANRLGKKGEKSRPTQGFFLGQWEKADENPDLATDDGKINLKKPGGLGSVDNVDYNPYIHIRPTLVNKQFKNAWERDDLVYVKTLYPASEEAQGYHAEKAALPVGRHPWNGGELILSRWDKPVEIVPWERVADDWEAEFKERGVEFDIVPPKLLPILAERGVEILPPHAGMGKRCNDAYEAWKNKHPDGPGGGKSVDSAVAEAEQMTETNPTDGQKESGNYRKGHVKVDGFDISIEQPKGSTRSGVDADGKEWSQEMHNTYGYIRGTEGVDGDHIDVFLSDHLDGWNGNVYVVDQVNKDRSFDEHKVMYGFNSEQEARDAYLSNYEEGWTGLGNITGVSREEFKKWVDSSHRKNKPFAEYKNVKPLQSTNETGTRFSLKDDEERTLMGMHNITAEKLRSALKLGGLANPSMAVVNTEVGGFTNFGEISLIPSSDLIASRTGGNAGTWGADAYSPRFPETHRRLGKGGDKKMRAWVKGLKMRQEMEYNTEEQFNDYYNGFNIRDNALVYPFLHEKGLSGEVDYYTHMNVDQRLEDDLREVNGDQWALLKRFDEDEEYKKKLTDIVVGDELRKISKKDGETFQEFRDRRREWAKQIRDGLTGEDGYINRNLAEDLLYAQARAYRENGKFSESRTVSNAEQYIRDHGMEDEYKQYFDDKMQELGAETQVYAGSDSQGRSKYKPVSLDQVSRMMKKQGRAGGEGGIFEDSPGAIRAKLLTPMKTLDQIRKQKGRIVDHEQFEQAREDYQNELREYADTYARGSMGALADIITSSNMAATAKRYNIDLDADAVAELNKFKNRVRALPTEYFETKFERPVMLEEFKKAVVPDDLPLDLQGALQRAGLEVVEYKHGDNADRERVTLDAVKNDGGDIRFSISAEEQEAQTHSENFKRWFGDWENDPENASKVVDEEGKPLVVYHVDRDGNGFTIFDTSIDKNLSNFGSHFGTEKAANVFSINKGSKKYAVYLNIKNPLEVVDYFADDNSYWANLLVKMVNENNIDDPEINAVVEDIHEKWPWIDGTEETYSGGEHDAEREESPYQLSIMPELYKAVRKAAEMLGYDGFVYENMYEDAGNYSYVAFHPEQIKSATENNGDFSRENPDIRFSVGEESQKIFDTAKRKFGETKDIREAGYVLPDGVMLDFSGRHELDPGTDSSFLAGRRATDHRAINQISFIYDENGDEVDTGVSSDMPDFIKRGAIRIDNNAGSINLSVAPTMAQRRVLRELIRRNGGDVQVDFGDGWNSDHYVEYEEASAQRVLGDIDRYFDEGIKPESNVRFSLSGDGTVDEYNRAVNMTGRTFNVGGREVKPGITRYNFQEAFQDSILAVKKLQQVVERHFGIKLPTRENAWMYENRLSSINMHERKSFIDKVYEPMMKIADRIMKRGVKEKELNAYLICKHGLERNQVFAMRDANEEANEIVRNGGTPDMQQLIDKYRQRDYSGLTGVTGIEGDISDIEAEAQRIVDEFEQKHGQLCGELWDAIRKATQWSLRKSYQSGMMSAATFDHVRNMFQYYIPLRGWSETTAEDVYSYMMGEHGAFNGVLKKAEGRTSVADDPLATIGNMAESALIQGNRNLLKQHLLRMAQNHPTDVCQVRDVWLVEGPGGVWEPHWPNIPEDATPDEIDQILQDHEADMQQLEASGQAKRVRNNLDIPYRIDPRHVPEHAVVAKVAGIDHVVYINGNPRAAQAINGQTGAPRVRKNDGFMRLVNFVFGDVKRFYSSVLTSLNINFSGANFVRDLPHAYAMTFMKQGPLKAAEYIAKSFQVIPWVFKNQLVKTGTSQMDRYFQEFLSSGAVTGYAHINDVDAWKANNKRRFARLSALGKAKVAVPRALGEVINAIGWFSETLELIPRFTAFLAERQAGKDIATATKAAKDITTNFNKKGSEVTPGVWGAVANTLRYMKMFFNPIVQGMYQFVDVASMGKENKWVGPRMVLATMHLPVLGAIVPYLNQFLLEALGGDDDDDYWLLNEYTRRNNVCIFTGNGYVKIPIAPVFRELYGMGEVVATRHYGKADNEKTAIDLIDQLRTMGSVEGQSSYNEWSLARFLLPEHFAPLIDVMNNENFTGGPIYYDNNYKEYAPEYTKAKKSTWSPLVAASKWLNEMMGGDEDIAADNSGKWMNPAVWQHLITNVGGGFAQLAGDVVAGVTDITEGKEIDPSNIPVLKRFYSGSSDERANWARFGIYKDYEKDYTMAKEKYQALDKRGLSPMERADEIVKFAESHPKAAAIYAVWEGGIKGADIPQRLEKLGKDDPAYWDLVKDAVAKAEKAMNSGYVRAWEQKRKDRPDSMSDKELNERFDKSDNDSIRHIMAKEIAKRAGSQDFRGLEPQDDWSDKSVAAWEAYQSQRTSDDIKADAELSNLLKVDDDEKDKERIKILKAIKNELKMIRRGKDATSRSAGVKGLGEGDDQRVMNELRAARKQLIEDLKNGSAEQAYRNLERRTMRLGLRKKAKEL